MHSLLELDLCAPVHQSIKSPSRYNLSALFDWLHTYILNRYRLSLLALQRHHCCLRHISNASSSFHFTETYTPHYSCLTGLFPRLSSDVAVAIYLLFAFLQCRTSRRSPDSDLPSPRWIRIRHPGCCRTRSNFNSKLSRNISRLNMDFKMGEAFARRL